MPTNQMTTFIHHLRGALLSQDGGGLTDRQLLECFIERRDEAAFTALVRRHGPMVLGVCQRVLGNSHDAEDAFQATFLILVRRAASIRQRELLANWLYGVAHRTALEARVKAARHQARERQMKDLPHPAVEPEGVWQDLRSLLDEELNRLPEKYRAPLVLCVLEGRSRNEVARQLNLPEGTLSSRLATAKSMLAKRLTRRGLALSSGVLAMTLSKNAALACEPSSLVLSAVRAALLVRAGQVSATGAISAPVASLMQGVLKVMFIRRMKIAAALILGLALVGTGAGVFGHRALNDKSAATQQPDGIEPPARENKNRKTNAAEVEKKPDLVGRITAVADDGKTLTLEILPQNKGDGPTKAQIKLTDETKFLLSGVDPSGVIQANCEVWLVPGSKDTVARIRLGPRK